MGLFFGSDLGVQNQNVVLVARTPTSESQIHSSLLFFLLVVLLVDRLDRDVVAPWRWLSTHSTKSRTYYQYGFVKLLC